MQRLHKSSQKLVLGCTLAVVVIALVVVALRPTEPAYLGKPLTVWLRTYGWSSSSARGSREWNQADDAVRHMGTNCIPTLLHMLRDKDSKIKLSLVALAKKQTLIKIHFVPAAERNAEASKAFLALGDSAKGAVPALMRIYHEDISADSQAAIEDCFAWIGSPARPAVPLLLQAAANPNLKIRAGAVWALGEIHASPEVCVPELVRALNDTDDWVLTSAAHALGKFGTDAQSAVPSLTQLADVSSGSGAFLINRLHVSLEARNALKKIQPESVSPSTQMDSEPAPVSADWWSISPR